MSDELPPLPEFPQSKSYAFGPVEQQWVREYATAYASEAVRAAVERERAGWFRSLASAGDAQAKAEKGLEPVALEFELLLVKFQEEVWSAAQEGDVDYERAGIETAMKLIAVYHAHPPTSDEWHKVALQLGELLSSNGPPCYYEMVPVDWLAWAKRQIPPTSEWNDAIEAAMAIVLERTRVNNIPGTKRGYLLRQLETTFGLIRALKREPR